MERGKHMSRRTFVVKTGLPVFQTCPTVPSLAAKARFDVWLSKVSVSRPDSVQTVTGCKRVRAESTCQ